jgi:hypothetical protein
MLDLPGAIDVRPDSFLRWLCDRFVTLAAAFCNPAPYCMTLEDFMMQEIKVSFRYARPEMRLLAQKAMACITAFEETAL